MTTARRVYPNTDELKQLLVHIMSHLAHAGA
jgi:hypothetical protein